MDKKKSNFKDLPEEILKEKIFLCNGIINNMLFSDKTEAKEMLKELKKELFSRK